MRRITDPTGRFPERLYYDNDELDNLAEQLINEFIIKLYGKLVIPVPTDDLIKLIERDTSDLDSYADLSVEEEGVQGVTSFIYGSKPKVRIAASLWEDRSGHRLRTTLMHEYGHVKLHTPLFTSKGAQTALDLFPSCCESQKCHRDTIIHEHQTQQGGDWLEWQAGYMSGALLMPSNHVCAMLDQIGRRNGNSGSAETGSPYALALINTIAGAYDVSKDAARIRLIQLGRLTKGLYQNQESLF